MGKGGGKGKVRRREKKETGKDREKGNEANRKGEEKNGKAVAPKERRCAKREGEEHALTIVHQISA